MPGSYHERFRDAAARAVPSVVTIKVRTRDREANSGGDILDVVGENDTAFDGFGSGSLSPTTDWF